MPEIFRAFGFTFYFFSREHAPIHVHILGNDGSAKFVWNGKSFVLTESYNIKTNDLKKISGMIEENKDIIVKHWNKYFGTEEYDED